MQTKTSESHPLRVDFIESMAGPGRLGLTLAPGKKCESLHGFTWDRDLGSDLRVLAQEYEVDVLVSLLEGHEFESLKIRDLPERARESGMQVKLFPIEDVNVPANERLGEFRELIVQVAEALRTAKKVVVHCRGGLGRAGLTSACILVEQGTPPAQAISQVRNYRPGAIETARQEQFVHEYAIRAATWS